MGQIQGSAQGRRAWKGAGSCYRCGWQGPVPHLVLEDKLGRGPANATQRPLDTATVSRVQDYPGTRTTETSFCGEGRETRGQEGGGGGSAGPGNLSLPARKEPGGRGGTGKEEEKGDNGGGPARGRGGGPALPARTEGAGRGKTVVAAHSRSPDTRKARGRVTHCPTSYQERLSGQETRPWRGQRGRNLPQRATPRAGSLGSRAVLRAGTGAAGRDWRARPGPHTIGPLWWAERRGASDSSTGTGPPSCLTTWEPTERQIEGDKEMHALTVAGLFLEMGRLSVPPALPASVPLDTACKGPHPIWGSPAPHNGGGEGSRVAQAVRVSSHGQGGGARPWAGSQPVSHWGRVVPHPGAHGASEPCPGRRPCTTGQ